MDLLSLGEEEEDEAPVPTSSPRPSASSHTPPQSSSAYKSPKSPLASHSPPVSPSSEGARGVTGIPPGMHLSCILSSSRIHPPSLPLSFPPIFSSHLSISLKTSSLIFFLILTSQLISLSLILLTLLFSTFFMQCYHCFFADGFHIRLYIISSLYSCSLVLSNTPCRTFSSTMRLCDLQDVELVQHV